MVQFLADVSVEARVGVFQYYVLLGFAEFRYPPHWWISLGRADAQPWWDAWRPALLAIFGAVSVLLLMICWALLATIYFLPARLTAFLADRYLNLAQGWRLSSAAVLPGAVFLSLAIVLYALTCLDLPLLGLAVALHLLIGWIYLALALFRLPRPEKKELAETNPFAAKH